MMGSVILFGLAVIVAFGFGLLVGGIVGWNEAGGDRNG